MIEKREKMKDFFGTVLTIVLFFLFMCAFYNSSDNATRRSFHYELSTEIDSRIAALDNVQEFSAQHLNSITYETNFNIFSKGLKIINYNRLINQKTISLQKAEFVIKTLIPPKFFYQYHYQDTEAFPDLS
jgi:hypothetical protein